MMDFNPDDEMHWVYLAKALDYASQEDHDNLSDQNIIDRTANAGLLARSTLARFRFQGNKASQSTSVKFKINNDSARKIWNFFIRRNNNPHVNRFSHRVDFDKYQTYLGLLSFFGTHPSKHSSLSKSLSGRYAIYSRSEMFQGLNKVVRGVMDFLVEADGLVISTMEHHRYSGSMHSGGAVVNHYYEGYAIERHSQIFVFSKSAHRSTPKLMIIDKRWTDQDDEKIAYMEGLFLKGSFGSAPFLGKVCLVRPVDSVLPDIIDESDVDPVILGKIGN